ncbi:MAG: hypothetical protein AAF745_02885 [Planctomycetota bacterium]
MTFTKPGYSDEGWCVDQFGKRHAIVRPDGTPMLLLGLNHCNVAMPNNPSMRFAHFQKMDATLRGLNFNNLGYGAPKALQDRWPYIASAQFHSASHAHDAQGFGYIDVFDAGMQQRIRDQVAVLCQRHQRNPNLIGYFWTDTPRWDISTARRLRGDDWVSAIRRLPSNSAGKRRYVEFLADRYKNSDSFSVATNHWISSFDDLIQYDFREFDRDNEAMRTDDEAFLGLIASELYSVIGQSFDKHAPGQLLFGERYKLHDHPPQVLREAIKWIDVLSIQPGPEVGPRPGPGQDEQVFDVSTFDELHRTTRLPILICDHKISFATPDRPITLWHQAASELDALRLTERFIRAAIDQPYIVGVQNCQYKDDFRPERGNMLKQGLIRENGQPYQQTHDFLSHLNSSVLADWNHLLEKNRPKKR